MTAPDQYLAPIQARLDAASKGPWLKATGYTADGSEPVTTYAQKSEFLALSLNSGRSKLWLVDNNAVIPAVTGDGPKAEANANFIANAPTDLAKLLNAVRAVEALHECDPDFGKCTDCDDEWPCRTAAALTAALGGAE